MQQVSQTVLLLLRNSRHLTQATEEASSLISHLVERNPRLRNIVIRGVWVDEALTTNLPVVLKVPDGEGRKRPVPVVQTMGRSGVWALCWLDDTELAHDNEFPLTVSRPLERLAS